MPPATAFERMLERTGKTLSDFHGNSKVGDIFRRAGVRRTAEFERIYFLPRRDWQRLSADGYRERLSQHLRVPGSQVLLREAQVAVLTELYDLRGCLGQIGLGEGKTLITAVAPTILNAQRPVLLAPAKLRDKTSRDFAALRKDWLVHPRIEFISYQQLGLERYANLLEEIAPDLIMCDEVHRLKNMQAAVTRRVRRRMKNAPKTVFMGLSGTLSARSLHDYWHLLMWAVGAKLMPLPQLHPELIEWALAVDEKVEESRRVAPGALLDLVPADCPADAEPLTKARLGVQERLRQTPGFVITQDTSAGASITLEFARPPRSQVIERALTELRQSQVTPNGEELITAVDLWRFARQLSCGFYYAWQPPAPLPWLEARKNWARYVRGILNTSPKLDSPFQVQQNVQNGKLTEPYRMEHPNKPNTFIVVPPDKLLARWLEERPKFTPDPVAFWVDDSYLRWLLKKYVMPKEFGPSLIWVEHTAVGQRIAQLTGFPYCNRNARDKAGRHIEDLGGQHVIASIASCGEGVNLQNGWSRNVVVSCPPSGVTWEQMIGRTHRAGQEADVVDVIVLNACREQEDGFEQAVCDARYAYETQGQKQRLLLVDRV